MMGTYKDVDKFFEDDFQNKMVATIVVSNYKRIVTKRKLCNKRVDSITKDEFSKITKMNLYRNNDFNRRRFDEINLRDKTTKNIYLLWYPLIAACSFIRTNKSHPFAVEYIVPQLLMQWVRTEMSKNHQEKYNKLIGIRYFSCASERASDMGFNYVFPVSGMQISPQLPYCPILSRAFRLTNPHFINEYINVSCCERALIDDNNIDFIDA